MSNDRDLALRARIRREVLHELKDLLQTAAAVHAGSAHLIVLSDYEVANLREALISSGYASVYRSPLAVLNTGDWLGQIVYKLQGLAEDTKPNATSGELADRANQWKGQV